MFRRAGAGAGSRIYQINIIKLGNKVKTLRISENEINSINQIQFVKIYLRYWSLIGAR
jgi:hypothetical protein